MGYHTVFDVTQVGFQWWIPLLIFIFGALFVGIGWAVKTSGDKASLTKGTFFQIGGAVGILGALVFFTSMYVEYGNAQKAFTAHAYSISEGVVKDFVPMPPGGHATESFVVNGVRFEYGAVGVRQCSTPSGTRVSSTTESKPESRIWARTSSRWK